MLKILEFCEQESIGGLSLLMGFNRNKFMLEL